MAVALEGGLQRVVVLAQDLVFLGQVGQVGLNGLEVLLELLEDILLAGLWLTGLDVPHQPGKRRRHHSHHHRGHDKAFHLSAPYCFHRVSAGLYRLRVSGP